MIKKELNTNILVKFALSFLCVAVEILANEIFNFSTQSNSKKAQVTPHNL